MDRFYNKALFFLVALFLHVHNCYPEIELGPSLGIYLPANLTELDQVVKAGALHVGFPLKDTGAILVQGEYGQGNNAYITGILTDVRIPEITGDFIPYFITGLHLFYTQGSDHIPAGSTGNPISSLRIGFNIGGGFCAQIKDNIYLDFQIRLNGNPGKIMFISSGLNFLL